MFIFGRGVIFNFYLQKVLAGITVQRVRRPAAGGKSGAGVSWGCVQCTVCSTGVQWPLRTVELQWASADILKSFEDEGIPMIMMFTWRLDVTWIMLERWINQIRVQKQDCFKCINRKDNSTAPVPRNITLCKNQSVNHAEEDSGIQQRIINDKWYDQRQRTRIVRRVMRLGGHHDEAEDKICCPLHLPLGLGGALPCAHQ